MTAGDPFRSMDLSQTNERDRVKARIKALTDKTVSNGCTEAEAMSAAEMVGRLLERYALTMDEIDVRQSACVQMEMPIGGQKRRPIDGCVTAIARFCDCKVWLATTEAGRCYIFFGFEADATLARYLFQVIDQAIRSELDGYRRRERLRGLPLRRASLSFQQGMATRVAERLEAMHQARDAAVAAQRTTGTALMLVKHGVVEDAFRATAIRLVSSGQRTRMPVNGAFRNGMAAGDRVNLNRPVGGRGGALLG